MRVSILSKLEFEKVMRAFDVTDDNVASFRQHGFICILDSNSRSEATFASTPHFKEDHVNVIRLWFDDVDREKDQISGMKHVSLKPMDKEQANSLLLFLENQKANHVHRLYVHCLAGVARSGAVGTFINEWSKSDKESFGRENPKIKPNAAVLRVLHEAWEEQKSQKSHE